MAQVAHPHNVLVTIVASGNVCGRRATAQALEQAGYGCETIAVTDIRPPTQPELSRTIFLFDDLSATMVVETMSLVRRFFGNAGAIAVVPNVCAEDQAAVLNAGADYVLSSAVDAALLLSVVNALMRRLLDDWAPDKAIHASPSNSTLRIGSSVIQLRRMEFRICEYLLLNRGRWVSERELLRNVFEVRHDRITSLVRVHVTQIRKAMGAYRSYLVAKKGVGYRFRNPEPVHSYGRVAGADVLGTSADAELD